MKRRTALAVLLLTAAPGVVHAAGEKTGKSACNSAAEAAQLFRDTGKLTDARKQALECSAPQCPSAIQTDCAQWLTDLDARIPSIVVSATDAGGNDVNDVSVTIDGATAATSLDGRAIQLDPGPHHFTFTRPGSLDVEKNVSVGEGERTRPIRIQFQAPPPPPSSQPARAPRPNRASAGAIPVVPIVLGAVGVAGLATFFVYHLSAKSDLDDLRSACAPSCSEDAADTVDRKIMVSHIALGVGVTALVGAVFTLVYPRMTGASSVGAAARAWNTF